MVRHQRRGRIVSVCLEDKKAILTNTLSHLALSYVGIKFAILAFMGTFLNNAISMPENS